MFLRDWQKDVSRLLIFTLLGGTLQPYWAHANDEVEINLQNNPFYVLSQDQGKSNSQVYISERNKKKRQKYRIKEKAKKARLKEASSDIVDEGSLELSSGGALNGQVSSAIEPILKQSFKTEERSTLSSFSIPSGTQLVLFSVPFLPTVAAQAMSVSSESVSSAPVIDSTVACIIARELAEGTMFAASHLGAVIKNPDLLPEDKRYYIKGMAPALMCGVLSGGVISVALGFSLAQAVGNLDTVSNGVELGEAISKTIGAWFVTKMTLKAPKWFGISNYREPAELGFTQPQGDVENPGQDAQNHRAAIGSRLAMSLSLFWNTLRESTEGGVLTGIAALLSKNSMDALGPSIGVGAGSAVVLGGGMALGAKYVSPKGFGAAATGLAELLAIGLITGAIRSYEEVYAADHDGTRTTVIYDVGGTPTGDTLTAFEFMGISDNLTYLQLATWVTSAATITGLHIWHNYLGKPLVPPRVKSWVRSAKRALVAPFRACFNRLCSSQEPQDVTRGSDYRKTN